MKATASGLLVLSIIAICTLLISVTSCKKNTDNGAPTFSATIGGEVYNSSYTYAFYYTPDSKIFIDGLEEKAGDSIYLRLVVPESANVNSRLSFNEASLY